MARQFGRITTENNKKQKLNPEELNQNMVDVEENTQPPENLEQMNLNPEALEAKEKQQLFDLATKFNMYISPGSSEKKRDNKVAEK